MLSIEIQPFIDLVTFSIKSKYLFFDFQKIQKIPLFPEFKGVWKFSSLVSYWKNTFSDASVQDRFFPLTKEKLILRIFSSFWRKEGSKYLLRTKKPRIIVWKLTSNSKLIKINPWTPVLVHTNISERFRSWIFQSLLLFKVNPRLFRSCSFKINRSPWKVHSFFRVARYKK